MGFKNFAKKLGKGARRAKKIIGGGARTVKTILGAADKLSGGAATRMLSADPRMGAALQGVNMAAGV
tara:strand:- start:311 stop:511 length:201 start_codon:yes stop_codon:yes gene_type:complete